MSGYRKVAKDQPQRNLTQSDGSFKLLSSKKPDSTLARRCVNVFVSTKSYLIEFSRVKREVREEKAGMIERAVDVVADKILVLDLDDNEECELSFRIPHRCPLHYYLCRRHFGGGVVQSNREVLDQRDLPVAVELRDEYFTTHSAPSRRRNNSPTQCNQTTTTQINALCRIICIGIAVNLRIASHHLPM